MRTGHHCHYFWTVLWQNSRANPLWLLRNEIYKKFCLCRQLHQFHLYGYPHHRFHSFSKIHKKNIELKPTSKKLPQILFLLPLHFLRKLTHPSLKHNCSFLCVCKLDQPNYVQWGQSHSYSLHPYNSPFHSYHSSEQRKKQKNNSS